MADLSKLLSYFPRYMCFIYMWFSATMFRF